MWYAINSTNKTLVAHAETFTECSEKAFAASPWGTNPAGEVGPYFITNTPPEWWNNNQGAHP